MPGLYKDEGIVLKTIKLGEADRIVTIFTRNNGKVRAVAKGIRKTKSRFGARLEPFTHAHLMIYKGRSLDTITGVDIVTSFDQVRTDYRRLTAASALVEIVEKITPEREKAFSTYTLLLGGLEALAANKVDTLVPAFLVKLLSLSGYHPQLSVCAGCGLDGPLGAFSSHFGGAVCDGCWREDRDSMRLDADRIALLARLLRREFGEDGDPVAVGEVTQVLRRYAEYHLERPLRSLQLLATAKVPLLMAIEGVPPERVPAHVALIMDGNGRWAARRGLKRSQGHEAGERALFDVVEGALEAGIRYLSAYAFSTENWSRPEEEVEFLLNFNRRLLRQRRDDMNERGVRIRRLGRRDPVPQDVLDEFDAAEEKTKHNTTMDLMVCFNYGGRAEIEDAAAKGDIASNLYAPDLPDVDLMIRTSGEMRTSNFLLWQAAYAELYFTETLWPDFDRHALWDALRDYAARDRRFGGL